MRNKTLVIILAETREYEKTFNKFKKNVIDILDAELCLCIGYKKDYNYDNPFYKLAKYKFTYNEPDDFAEGFNLADKNTEKENYEKLINISSNLDKNSIFLGTTDNLDIYNLLNKDYDEIIFHNKNHKTNPNEVYGLYNTKPENLIQNDNVITYRKPINWREFLKIKNQFMGGILDEHNQHPGSAGILIFFRWFLLYNLKKNNLLNKFNRFLITRSDFIWDIPHPSINILESKYIWFPNGEYYSGLTDRYVLVNNKDIVNYLNILDTIICKSNEYFFKMYRINRFNLEKLILFHLYQCNLLNKVRLFPYIMYSIRSSNGTTRCSKGIFNEELQVFIKYPKEFNSTKLIKKTFDFYEWETKHLNKLKKI